MNDTEAAYTWPTQQQLLATAHLPELDIDLLVTAWTDGTGEVAYRERRWNTWSAPVALVVAP